MANPVSGHMTAEGVHRIAYRVHFEDTDAGGIMYHGNFLNFTERARTEWLRDVGHEQRELMRTLKVGFVVRHLEIDYFKPAFLDDILRIESSLKAMGRSSMTMQQDVYRGDELVVAVSVVLVCIGSEYKPARIPDEIRKDLSSGRG